MSKNNKTKYLNLKKSITIMFVIPFLILTMYIIYITSVRYISFQKVYSSYEDKKLSQNIEKKLEKMAKKVQETKEPLSIRLNKVDKNRQIDKLCVAGPYYPDINKLMGINWKQSSLWERNVVNDDRLFSIFLIYKNNVIPIKLERSSINYIKSYCLIPEKNIDLKLIEDHSKVYLKIIN